jgi:hypothetical protein
MRFVLVRESGPAALATALRLDARLLGVGESLRWPELGANSCFVIPLGAPAATVRDAAAA